MRAKGHLPIRMCMGCGSRKKKEEMIRLVRVAPEGTTSGSGTVSGRGFYLCPDLRCLKVAQKKTRGSGFWEFVDLDRLRYQVLCKVEDQRRQGNGKE